MAHEHIAVSLTQDEDGYPPFEEEELAVTPAGPGRYRVVTAPAFAPSLAAGDVVAAVEAEGRLWATEVVEESDHWLARLIPLGSTDGAWVAKVFSSMGCQARYSEYGLVVIDVPPEVDPEHVLAELRAGGEAGEWEWTLPVAPARHVMRDRP